MPANDLELLSRAARDAGEIAKSFFRSNPRVWDKTDNAGPVTEADLEIDRMLKATLQSARPDHGWLSEETDDDPSRLVHDDVFIVDPIDGTRAFIEGSSHWSHSLAISKNGKVTHAAVYLPVNDLMFTAEIGKGAQLNGNEISVSHRNEVEGACILSAKPNFETACWPGGFPNIKRNFRSSLAYRLCLVAEGSFDGMLTLRGTWEWDVAAGALITTEAGGVVSDQRGQLPVFNSATAKLDGMVATTPQIHAPLISRLTGT